MVGKLGLSIGALALAMLFAAAPDIARSQGQDPPRLDRATFQKRMDILTGRVEAALKRAKREQEGAARTSGNQRAAYCDRFRRELRTARSLTGQIHALQEQDPDRSGLGSRYPFDIEALEDEGCPRGTFFQPTTTLAQQFRQDLVRTLARARQAVTAEDDITFQVAKVDLNNLIGRGEYLAREDKDPAARSEIRRLTDAGRRLGGELPLRAEPLETQIFGPSMAPRPAAPPVAEPPPGPTGPQLPAPGAGSRPLSFSMSGGGGVLRAPATSFVGVRDPVTQDSRWLGFNSASTDVGPQLSASIAFRDLPNPFGDRPGTFRFGGSYARFSQSTSVPFFDPGANNLLIVGTGVDPFGPGFSISPGTGTFNDVTNYHYSRSIDRFNVFGQYTMPFVRQAGFSASLLAQFGYTRTNIDVSESGFLPNVPFEFRSAWDLGANTFTPGLGLQFSVPLSPTISMQLYGWAGPAISNASGSDRFSFSGALSGDQHNPISANHVGFAGEIGGGFTFRVDEDNKVMLTGSFLTSDSHPVVVRTGEANERSRIAFENEEGWSAILRWQRNFYP